MTSLRKLEEEAARCTDPEARKQLLDLIEQRRKRQEELGTDIGETLSPIGGVIAAVVVLVVAVAVVLLIRLLFKLLFS